MNTNSPLSIFKLMSLREMCIRDRFWVTCHSIVDTNRPSFRCQDFGKLHQKIITQSHLITLWRMMKQSAVLRNPCISGNHCGSPFPSGKFGYLLFHQRPIFFLAMQYGDWHPQKEFFREKSPPIFPFFLQRQFFSLLCVYYYKHRPSPPFAVQYMQKVVPLIHQKSTVGCKKGIKLRMTPKTIKRNPMIANHLEESFR